MTPREFVTWLGGFMDATDEEICCEQYATLQNQLNAVEDDVIPIAKKVAFK